MAKHCLEEAKIDIDLLEAEWKADLGKRDELHTVEIAEIKSEFSVQTAALEDKFKTSTEDWDVKLLVVLQHNKESIILPGEQDKKIADVLSELQCTVQKHESQC